MQNFMLSTALSLALFVYFSLALAHTHDPRPCLQPTFTVFHTKKKNEKNYIHARSIYKHIYMGTFYFYLFIALLLGPRQEKKEEEIICKRFRDAFSA